MEHAVQSVETGGFTREGAMPGGRSDEAGSRSTLPYLLHRASQRAEWHIDRLVAPFQLTARQFTVLDEVDLNAGLNQIRLGSRTGIDRSTLVNIIDRLEGRGLILRLRSDVDRRSVALQLTEEGRKQLEIARPLVRQVNDHLLSMLPEAMRLDFVSCLENLIEPEA